MGDGVLAYFGYPQAHEDAAERAVRAGLALVRAVGALSAPFGDRMSARVGIATGLVVVGDLIGDGASREEAVVGEGLGRALDLVAEGAVEGADLRRLFERLRAAEVRIQDATVLLETSLGRSVDPEALRLRAWLALDRGADGLALGRA